MALFGGITLPGHPDLENIRKLDLLPVRAIQEMMRYGMAIDVPHLQEVSSVLAAEMKVLREEICSYIPESKLDEFISRSNLDADDESGYLPMNVESNQQLAELMFEVLGIGKDLDLKRTKGGKQVSTGRRQLEQLRLEHPVVSPVLAYRERSKLKNTYADRLPEIARLHPKGRDCPVCGLFHLDSTRRVHTQVLGTRTRTGRYASKDPNLQNIPIRSKHGQEIRRGFVASPGTALVSVDFSQIELRLLAFLANVIRMIEVFLLDKDIHTTTAMEAFDISEEEVNRDKIRYRNPSKNVNFAVVFRESAMGLFEQLVSDNYGKAGIPVPDWLTLEWCEGFLRKWFKLYPEVKAYMDLQDYRSYRYGMVWDLCGRVRLVPEVKSVHKRVVEAGLRQAGNMPIQGFAAELIKLAIAEVQEFVEMYVRPQGVWCWPLITVHDELLLEVQEDYAEAMAEIVRGIFEMVLVDRESWESMCMVPIKASSAVMSRWEKG
jgi:DNA polymerase-1